jgi:hypothetical protein
MTAPEIVRRCIGAFEQLHIPYVAVGALSVNVYSPPRLTHDADFVVQLRDIPMNEIVRALGTDFELEAQMSFETITATSRYRLRHRASEFLIELFLLSDDAHDRARFDRRMRLQVGDSDVFVLTVEDLIITKLRWSRQGKRPKDTQDIKSVLSVQLENIDLNYIRLWCNIHGTTELFEKLLRESPAG